MGGHSSDPRLGGDGCADAGNAADTEGHRLHKPGVAGSSPAAASTVSFDEPIDAYHSDAEWWSKSMLWDYLSKGPAFFHARHIARTLKPYAGGGAFAKGTLVHQWAEVGDANWWPLVVVYPDDVLGQGGRRTKKTEEWEAGQPAGSIFLKSDEVEEYRAQFAAIKANSVFDELSLATTAREFSIRWVEQTTKAKLKCRPDAATGDCLWDIKTTREQMPLQTFWRSVIDYGYDLQAALYLEGARAAGINVDRFVFFVTSTVPPYSCHAVVLPQRLIDKARRRLLTTLAELQSRLAFDHWLPEDTGSITELYIPGRFMED